MRVRHRLDRIRQGGSFAGFLRTGEGGEVELVCFVVEVRDLVLVPATLQGVPVMRPAS